jgi:hypothetical protein
VRARSGSTRGEGREPGEEILAWTRCAVSWRIMMPVMQCVGHGSYVTGITVTVTHPEPGTSRYGNELHHAVPLLTPAAGASEFAAREDPGVAAFRRQGSHAAAAAFRILTSPSGCTLRLRSPIQARPPAQRSLAVPPATALPAINRPTGREARTASSAWYI